MMLPHIHMLGRKTTAMEKQQRAQEAVTLTSSTFHQYNEQQRRPLLSTPTCVRTSERSTKMQTRSGKGQGESTVFAKFGSSHGAPHAPFLCKQELASAGARNHPDRHGRRRNRARTRESEKRTPEQARAETARASWNNGYSVQR
eukprot:XP_008648206.1 uncharacterized protein LOC100384824 [Zea mays]